MPEAQSAISYLPDVAGTSHNLNLPWKTENKVAFSGKLSCFQWKEHVLFTVKN